MYKNTPLVSIVVITYNSAEFIIETLNSIYNQTYNNLELIISDDSSKDNTITLAKNWVNQHKNRFTNTTILTSNKNLGTSININKGCKLAIGKWMKPVPGDDILIPEAIDTFVNYAEKNNSKIVYSKVKKLVKNKVSDISYPINNVLDNKQSFQQFNLLLNGAPFYSPTEFYSNKALKELKYFDESYNLVEDFPFLLKATKSGVKIDFINEALMYYRVSESSTSNSDFRKNNYVNKTYYNDLVAIFNNLLKPNINIHNLIGVWDQKIKLIRLRKTLNNGNTLNAFDNTKWLNLFNIKYILLKLNIIKTPE
ncbi:MAG: glycosyltransferase [Ichthyobacteriaceae bacterium]|nr:glycosyltransferase [Ichthyobacteriaceae bacterium]